MMDPERREGPGSYVMGEGSFCLRCADLLLQARYPVLGIISADPEVCHWAARENLPSRHPGDDLEGFLKARPFDYLFSANNPHVIPESLLSLPQRQAINYHDSLLPKYAGMYATSWALIQGEKRHGITWHIMSGKVDAGDILEQRAVDIEENETAFTLNIKCYQAALDAFRDLLEKLKRGEASPRPQNLAERSYFPLHEPPPAGGLIHWEQPAEDIAALVRGLDFGAYPNPLGQAKLLIGGEVYALVQAMAGTARSGQPAGTVLGIGHGLEVATRTQDLILTRLQTLAGEPVPIGDVAERHGLCTGTRLPNPPLSRRERLRELSARLKPHEGYWRRRLETLQAARLPYRPGQAPGFPNSQPDAPSILRRLSLPSAAREVLQGNGHTPSQTLLTLFAIYLCRIGATYVFDLGYQWPDLRDTLSGAEPYFEPEPPLRVELNPDHPFSEAYSVLENALGETHRRGTFARDMISRYPSLKTPESLGTPVRIIRYREFSGREPGRGSGLCLYLPESPAASEETWGILAGEAGLYDQEILARMESHLLRLLDSVVAPCHQAPAVPIARLPLLPAAEHERIRHWAAGAPVEPFQGAEGLVHRLFEEQAGKTPEAVAVYDAAASAGGGGIPPAALTYRELNRRANRIAHRLRRLGLGPKARVGLAVERSPAAVAGLLGILKAGGVHVPLDPGYPADRLRYMIADGEIRLILVDGNRPLPAGIDGLTLIDLRDAELEAESTADPDPRSVAEDPAYLIYTSGSTGEAKGVLVAQGDFARHCRSIRAAYGLTPADRVLQLASLNFDVSLEQILPPLLAGAAIVLGEACPAGEFHRRVLAYRLTVMDLPLGYFQQIVAAWTAEPAAVAGHGLRLLIVGNEAIPGEFVTRLRSSPLRHTRLLNAYGPTEAVISASLYEIPEDLDPGRFPHSLPIAQVNREPLLADRRLYVLDAHRQLLPMGVTGELHLGGILAHGYLNRPELTREAFIESPFEPGCRLYRTGDLARLNPDGTVEFMGRVDEQIKIRGFRVELGEIEASLRRHPEIQEAVAVFRDTRIVAYLVASTPAGTAEEWRAFLGEYLPGPMIPAVFVRVEALPRTVNGKVDRKALRERPLEDFGRCLGQAGFLAPATTTEQRLAEIWRRIFSREAVGRSDDFFDLGGHSLAALQLANEIQGLFRISLPLPSVFAHPSLSALARHVDEQVAVEALRTPPENRDRSTAGVIEEW